MTHPQPHLASIYSHEGDMGSPIRFATHTINATFNLVVGKNIGIPIGLPINLNRLPTHHNSDLVIQ